MTQTQQEEQVRGAIGGIVIALAVLIAIFAFYELAQAEALSGESLQTAVVANAAGSALGG